MGFHPIDEIPKVTLGHLISTETRTRPDGSQTQTARFLTYPIGIRRPATGTVTGQAYCGTCRTQVAVRIPSARLTRRRQRYRLAVAIVAAAPPLLVVWWTIVDYSVSVLFGLLCSALLAVPVPFALVWWWGFHGVRLARSESSGPHKIFARSGMRPAPAPGPRSSSAGGNTAGGNTGGGAKADSAGDRMLRHPVYHLRAGTDRATVLARLGPPTGSTTTGEVLAKFDTVVGGPLPDTEWWLYTDDPPGHNLLVVIREGRLESVEVEDNAQSGKAPPATPSSGNKEEKRRIRIDKDGLFVWSPTYAAIVLWALLGDQPQVDGARLRREYEDLRQTWHEATLEVLSSEDTNVRLQADLSRDAELPGFTAFTVATVPHRACAQVVALNNAPGAPFGSGTAYRVWRTVPDGEDRLALTRSHQMVLASGDQPAAAQNRDTPMDDERTARRLAELVSAHERLYELTGDKRLIHEAMNGPHLDTVLSAGTVPEAWISAAVEIRAIGHRLNREGGLRRMQTLAKRAAELRNAGGTLRYLDIFWDRIGDWRE